MSKNRDYRNQSAFDMSSAALSGAMDTVGALAQQNAATPQLMNEAYRRYADPFEKNVAGAAINQARDFLGEALVENQASAARSGAFGGSRHGLVDALATERTTEGLADILGQIRSQGYNTSMGLAQQELRDRADRAMGAAGAASGLGQQYFDIGRTIASDQFGMGQIGQQINQMILEGANSEFQQYVNSPQSAMALLMQSLGMNPATGATTTTGTRSFNPGLFDYLSAAAGVAGNMFQFKPMQLKNPFTS